jgi:hypothetical protein
MTGTPTQLRFAFYGRVSEGYQDQASSARWQRDFANELVAGRGRIVAQFFDIGCSRRLPWHNRPQAAALLAAVADPDRGFDAIVVGEYERAFYGEQLLLMAPIFKRHGVQLWLPELDGPVDVDNATHVALMMLLGVQSKREVLRARFRVIAAMRAQARGRLRRRSEHTDPAIRMSSRALSSAAFAGGRCKVNTPTASPTTAAASRRSTPWPTRSTTRAT